MSIAIQITTHAPASAIDDVADDVLKIVAKLDKAAKAATADDDEAPPPATARVFGTDYNGPKAKSVDRKLGWKLG